MAGTHVFYNSVLLRDCVTKKFDQQMVMDESRNHLTSKFRIRVDSLAYGFFNGAASFPSNESQLLSHASTIVTKDTSTTDTKGTATDRIGIMQRLLKEPRKDFFYAVHGGQREDIEESVYQIVVAATGPDDAGSATDLKYFNAMFGNDLQIRYLLGFNVNSGDLKIPRHNVIDTMNGPTPLDVQITPIGGKAFRVSFEIEVHRHLCLTQDPATDIDSIPFNLDVSEGAQSNPFVLSNTWASEESCDDLFRRTRTVSGTLRVRDGRYWAHAFRYLCMPGLLSGYQRKSQKFSSDPTNLVLKYQIEDNQAEAAPPFPAIAWKMAHSDSSKNEFGRVERQLSIRLIGRPRCDKELLLGTAIRILDLRFPGARVSNADFRAVRGVGFNVDAMVIQQASDDPSVELLCNIRQHLAGVGGFERAVEASTAPLAFLGYDPDNWPAPKPYDADTPSGIFACYLQRPCSQWHGMPQSQELALVDYETENTLPGAPETGNNYWEESGYESYVGTPLPGVIGGGAPLGPDELLPDIHRDEHKLCPYTYLEIDTKYLIEPGIITLPLSKPRVSTFSQTVEGVVRTVPRTQTVVNIPVHAGVMYREITIKATREGAPPELPEPAAILIDHNGVFETLVGTQTMVLQAPESAPGQQHRVFGIQARFRYVLDRPLTTTERYRMANAPSLATTPDENSVSGIALFGRGRIEHHASIVPASPGDGFPSDVLAPLVNNVDGSAPVTVGKTLIT